MNIIMSQQTAVVVVTWLVFAALLAAYGVYKAAQDQDDAMGCFGVLGLLALVVTACAVFMMGGAQ